MAEFGIWNVEVGILLEFPECLECGILPEFKIWDGILVEFGIWEGILVEFGI